MDATPDFFIASRNFFLWASVGDLYYTKTVNVGVYGVAIEERFLSA